LESQVKTIWVKLDVGRRLMFKGDGDAKLDMEKKEGGIQPIDSERFKSQIEFILEVDKLKKIMRRTMLS
jgi:hypothetical protein